MHQLGFKELLPTYSMPVTLITAIMKLLPLITYTVASVLFSVSKMIHLKIVSFPSAFSALIGPMAGSVVIGPPLENKTILYLNFSS